MPTEQPVTMDNVPEATTSLYNKNSASAGVYTACSFIMPCVALAAQYLEQFNEAVTRITVQQPAEVH
ncbi:hypothetical protein ETA_28600 [Erwinia tasmaniensis Et1/99]|uniref:Uncharacterized protein n=1 Tax=Erwinia tasmaniensis (strain DSM 17950 / CFBP 7177 / CIP 109463 / NCPPB 4357 / Et1/99) TaxID=465817 RepID=B2VEY4_ERWT9|nr:hypothetical protein ETA_28600 [Erwinia tasmaniensis Et1/99]